MKAIELLQYFRAEQDINNNTPFEIHDFDKAIEELEEYESDMDKYINFTAGSKCSKSREIKLRAWIGDRKIMKDVVTYIKHLNGFSISYLDSLGNESQLLFSKSHKIELRRYTNRKDINGVKIFEGDIMVLNNINPSYYVVKYEDNNFFLDGISIFTDFIYFQEREVIGNIDENPELLEEALKIYTIGRTHERNDKRRL